MRSISRSASALAAMLCVLAPAAGQSQAVGSGDAAYAALAKSFYYGVSFPRDPVNATGTGVHDYDDVLGRYDSATVDRRLVVDDDYLAKLSFIDRTTLSPEVAIDAQLLSNALNDDRVIYGEVRPWEHNPDFYVGLASGGVYGVLERAYAPLPVRARHAIARELAVPALLAQAESTITTVDATTAKLAYDDAVGSEDFFTTVVPEAFAALPAGPLRAQLARANGVAKAAMTSYAGWIRSHPLAHPSGTYAIGPKIYRERLKYEEALDMPLDRYLAIGLSALAATRAEFIDTAHAIDPNASPERVEESLGAARPTAASLLPTAQHDLVALRAFIVSHHIITLPSDADIKVVPTPVFARATTFASMDSPGPLETVAKQAYYNVTPIDASVPKVRQDQLLSFYNDYWLPLVSAHEVYPGHYVNYTIDKHLPLSLTRKLNWSSSFGEGWAHYSEQMMVDEGWGGGNPKVRLAQLGGALLRECRYVVGVREHTAGMSVEAGTKFFMDNAFMTREAAHKEALRGTQDATYGYYTLGKLEILKLRADMQKKLGTEYTLEKFHDAYLAHGDPPIPLLRPLLLGDADDGKVL
jgi:uncharacterized protein (DUF885 family)